MAGGTLKKKWIGIKKIIWKILMEYYHCSEKFFNISSTTPPNSKVKNNRFSFLFLWEGGPVGLLPYIPHKQSRMFLKILKHFRSFLINLSILEYSRPFKTI